MKLPLISDPQVHANLGRLFTSQVDSARLVGANPLALRRATDLFVRHLSLGWKIGGHPLSERQGRNVWNICAERLSRLDERLLLAITAWPDLSTIDLRCYYPFESNCYSTWATPRESALQAIGGRSSGSL